MGASDRRNRDKDLKSCILEAARELFAERGYDAVTMRKIAERIAYSPTAIYQHFEDKKSLVEELCARDFGCLSEALGRLAGIADPLERLSGLACEYVGFARTYPNHYRFVFMNPDRERTELPAEPPCGRPARDAYAFLRWTMSQAIEEGLLRPDLDDPDLCAQLVWGAIHGAIALELAMAREEWIEWRPLDKLATAVLDVVVRGLTRAGWSGPGSEPSR